ncbi:hypothetical protein D3C72_2469920 [compost metagenome]
MAVPDVTSDKHGKGAQPEVVPQVCAAESAAVSGGGLTLGEHQSRHALGASLFIKRFVTATGVIRPVTRGGLS